MAASSATRDCSAICSSSCACFRSVTSESTTVTVPRLEGKAETLKCLLTSSMYISARDASPLRATVPSSPKAGLCRSRTVDKTVADPL